MIKTKEEIFAALDANIPKSAVSTRQGGGTKALSYLEGWFVIDRMNKIFGPDAWSYDVTELRCVHKGELDGKYGAIFSASYSATVALFVQFPDGIQAKRITDVGFGNGTDKTDPGKPHELATKEAVTDALKRCAKSLGMSLGLALYDKKQENVGDEDPKNAMFTVPAGKKLDKPFVTGMLEALERAEQKDSSSPYMGLRGIVDAPKPAPTQTVSEPISRSGPGSSNGLGAQATSQGTPFDREALNKRITAMSKVVIAKRLKTLEELKADMKSKYGADSTAGLDDAEAKDLLTNLEAMANG